MYAIHTTPGFVIETRPKGEAGKLLSIFTRDLGLVTASAQGIRLEKSKLRYHSQEYSLGEFSFVRGKEYWRLVGVAGVRSDLQIWRFDLTPRIALLLKRLLHGEEAHPELFDHILNSLLYIANSGESNQFSGEQLKTLESIIVFRIVSLLGYIGNDREIKGTIVTGSLSIELLNDLSSQRIVMNRHINKALRESHL